MGLSHPCHVPAQSHCKARLPRAAFARRSPKHTDTLCYQSQSYPAGPAHHLHKTGLHQKGKEKGERREWEVGRKVVKGCE